MAAQSKPKPLEEVSGGDLSEVKKDPIWKTWLEKKDKWDKEEKREGIPNEEAHLKRGKQRLARDTHVKEEMSGIGSRQHKEEARAIREGKVAPSRTATIAAQKPYDLEEPSPKRTTEAMLLHENKGVGDAIAGVAAGGAKFGSKFTEGLSEELSGKPSAKQPEAPQPAEPPSETDFKEGTPLPTTTAAKPPAKMKPTGATPGATPAPSKAAIKSWEAWLEKKRSGKGRRRVKLDELDEEEEDAWMPLTKRQGEKVGYKPEHESIRESEGAGQATPQAEQFERSRPNVKRIQEQPKGVRSTGTSELPESKGEEVYPRGTVHVLPEVKDGIQTGKPAKDIHGKKIYTHVGGSPTGEKTKPLPKEEKRGYKDKPVPKKHTSNLPKNRKRFNYKKSESFVYKIWLMKEKPKKDEGQTQQEPKGAMGALRKKPVTYGTSIGTGLGEGEKRHEVKPKEDYKENYKPQTQVSSRAFQTGKPKLQGDKVDLKEHHAGLKRLVGRLRTGKWGRQASTGSNPKDIEGSGGSKKRKTPPTGAAPDMKVDKPSGVTEGEWQKKLVAERTASQKAGKKRVRLGDISGLQKLPKKKPSKYKDPQEMSKYPKKPVMGKGQQVKYKAWLADKGALGALGEGKLNRYTGKPKKLRYNPQRDLDDYPSEKQIDEKARKKREAKEKTDYFVEEIKMNIVYEDKIAPLLGAVAGAVGRGAMAAGRGLARGVKDNAGKMGEFAGGMMEGLAGDEEKMEEEQ